MSSIVDRLSVLLLLAVFAAASANAIPPAAGDAAFEARVRSLASELRCLVCQNQTIADSNADLAVDLKNHIREKLREGQSESQIIDFMVERYGEFVLYRPRLNAATALLWWGPLLLLAAGLATLYRNLLRHAQRGEAQQRTSACSSHGDPEYWY
jgi:cytochrome c-type biogenesis protein CcmH